MVMPEMPTTMMMVMEVVESTVMAPASRQKYGGQQCRDDVLDTHDHTPYATHSNERGMES
jgi:hypothetical protein